MARIGLALSGGGFRATLFHLGVIRLLSETGQLSQVKRIGAVSGGSILAAHLVLHWKQYTGSKDDFDKAAQELIRFVQQDIRGRVIRRWILALFPRILLLRSQRWTFTNLLQKQYSLLYNDRPLKDLRASDRPQVYFYSASLTTGVRCSFSRTGFRWHNNDPEEHSIAAPNTQIAFAVTASSAFPPLFPPVKISNETLFCDKKVFPFSHYLTDGGVYDNLGIDRLWWFHQSSSYPDLDLFISSDAEGNFDSEFDRRFTFIIGRNVRASDLLMTRVSSMQIERLTKQSQLPRFIRVGIKNQIFDANDSTLLPPESQRSLPNIRTDLGEFDPTEITALISHGYNCARTKLIEDKLLAADDTPRFSWDPLRNWRFAQSRHAIRQLRQSSRRRLGLWSSRDWASYAILSLLITLVVGAIGMIYIPLRQAVQLKQEAQEIRAVSFPRRLNTIIDRNVVIPFSSSECPITKSPNSDMRVNVTFSNTAAQAAELYWIDFSENKMWITTIQQGERESFETFVGHLWEAKVADGGELLGCYVIQGQQR
jgi:predicted acylesterase/phospholipase RssA